MNKIKFLSTILTVVLFSSCTKDDLTIPNAIEFSTSISTKATDLNFEANDSIGVFAESYYDEEKNRMFSNKKFTFTGDSFKSSGCWYAKEELNYDFYAYYPFDSRIAMDKNYSISYNIITDQSTEVNYKGSDLMIASVSAHKNDGSNPELIFSHALAKVVVNISGATNDAAHTLLIKNAITEATISLKDGTCTPGTAVSDIKPMYSGDSDKLQYSFFAIPQTLAAGTAFVTFTTSEKELSYTLETDITFEGGNKYEFNLTVGS